ncbi:hypothetical protein IGB42_02722 [Andreprevotia sp. IGB-42]|uniref:pilus assembly PilX family protein n=1 Tax=Andreprevotia sp. IGB-42 TaxID=2497473 RepID=UPI0013593B08|nr:pilus assembly PilX N-terminal domain-containing protein [Andreprevotia sp. IGB-42]KAF0812878.1 hypothetical protein IGB42_02722 [Andreprevotia sp. IGB-42]
MCRNGFALISALFLLVVLSALGAFVMTLSTTSQQSATLDFQGSRAYQAARAGIEYAAFQALTSDSCTSASISVGGLLADFVINVQCTRSTHNQAGNTITVYQLTATACNLGITATCGPAQRSPNYVERQISATVAKCLDTSGGACA